MLSRVSHMPIRSVVTCLMNVGDQTIQAFVTSSCQCCDCSSKFVSQTKGQVCHFVPTTSILKNTICEHTLDKFPTVSCSSFLKLWSSKQRIETLYNCSVFLFANSHQRTFFAYPSISYDHATVFAWLFSHSNNFQLRQQKFVIRTFFCTPH